MQWIIGRTPRPPAPPRRPNPLAPAVDGYQTTSAGVLFCANRQGPHFLHFAPARRLLILVQCVRWQEWQGSNLRPPVLEKSGTHSGL